MLSNAVIDVIEIIHHTNCLSISWLKYYWGENAKIFYILGFLKYKMK